MLDKSIVLQILAGDAAILGMLSFYVAGAPMVDRFNNFIQIFNEIVVCLALASMVLFTEFIPSPVDRYDYGYTLLYLVGLSIIINVIILFMTIVFAIYSAIRKSLLKKKKAAAMKIMEEKRSAHAKRHEARKAMREQKRNPKAATAAVDLEAIIEEDQQSEKSSQS